MTALAKEEAMHRMQVLQEMGVMPHAISKVRAILGQKYSGDITIMPKVTYSNFPRVLANPDTDFMVQACSAASGRPGRNSHRSGTIVLSKWLLTMQFIR